VRSGGAALLTAASPEGAKEFARQKIPARFGHLSAQLQGREYLLDRFTVADAYLTTVLNNWSKPAGVDLGEWPVLQSYVGRMRERPSVARAFEEEWALYQAERAGRS
jgi:glutathione S-transferase